MPLPGMGDVSRDIDDRFTNSRTDMQLLREFRLKLT